MINSKKFFFMTRTFATPATLSQRLAGEYIMVITLLVSDLAN